MPRAPTLTVDISCPIIYWSESSNPIEETGWFVSGGLFGYLVFCISNEIVKKNIYLFL
jgi:hypothetical protein